MAAQVSSASWRMEWKKLDGRGRGSVSFAELPQLLEALGVDMSEAEVEEAASRIQKWQASRLLLQGFLRWFTGDGGVEKLLGENKARESLDRCRELNIRKSELEAEHAALVRDHAALAEAAKKDRDLAAASAAEVKEARSQEEAARARLEAAAAAVDRLEAEADAEAAKLREARQQIVTSRDEARGLSIQLDAAVDEANAAKEEAAELQALREEALKTEASLAAAHDSLQILRDAAQQVEALKAANATLADDAGGLRARVLALERAAEAGAGKGLIQRRFNVGVFEAIPKRKASTL